MKADYTSKFMKDYEELLINNEKIESELRNTKYLLKLSETREQTLMKQNEELSQNINEIKEDLNKKDFEIARLKALLNMDGTNNGLPTSQTPINKQKVIPNTREKTNKSKGGQKGHTRHKLEKLKKEEITEEIKHEMCTCPCCEDEEIKETGKIIEKDEVDFKIVVEKKRHKFIEYKCEKCGKTFHEKIPNRLKEENQYGPQIQAFELALMNQGNVTINKAQKITYGMTNFEIDMSEGYIAKLQKRAANRLDKFISDVKKQLIQEDLLHWDDTVIMVDTNRSCLRFYGTEKIALYAAHEKKDKDGLDEDNILNLLTKDTVVMHDHNKVNYNEKYQFTNAECNQHLIRDLKKVTDILHHKWSAKLKELLNSMNNKRKRLIEKGKEEFPEKEITKFNEKFNEIMLLAYKENETGEEKYYYKDEKTLITRILDYKENYCLWIYDFNVPFTNNLSERALRGTKSKQKASGQFENIESAKNYANIKTYIETCYRNGINVYNALIKLSVGEPYTFEEVINAK